MISRLKELVKAAKTKQDALEIIHIEVQNMKIRLFDKNYTVKTSPGEPGPAFDEDLEENQTFRGKDKELADYFETVKGIMHAVDNHISNKPTLSLNSVEQDFIQLIEQKRE